VEIFGYHFPDELYYHRDHCWVKVEISDKVIIGLNEFFIKEAGEIINVDLPYEGEEIEMGKVCGKIQSSKWIGKIVAPVTGEIMEINLELEENSRIMNQDPYGEGWIMRVSASNLEDEIEELLKGKDLFEWLKKEMEKLNKDG
jgi:glycine cleavage system H protein